MRIDLLNTLIIIPPDPRGKEYTREMRCQEKREVLGTLKPPLTPALLCALFRERNLPFRLMENMNATRAFARLQSLNFMPGLILFPTCTPTITRDLAFAGQLKNQTGALLAAFGPHTSGIPRQTLEDFPALDFALIGEPEETALALAQGVAPDQLPGLAFRQQSAGITVNPPQQNAIPLDDFPIPDWGQFDLNRFRVPLFGEKFLLVELSRGCPYHCDFCVVPLTHTCKVREKSPNRVVHEIRELMTRFGISFFYFWGDTAVYNPRTMEAIADSIIAHGLDIQWMSNTRPEAVLDQDYANKLWRSGCRILSMGAESGDPEILAGMGKKLDIQTLHRAVRTLRAAHIQSFLFFMFGYPGETMRTLKQTRDLALRLDPDYANFYPVVPYPGTPLWKHCVENNLLLSNDWSRVDFTDYILRQPNLSPAQVMSFVRRARRDFYLRPSCILRTLRHLGTPRRAAEILKSIPAYFGQ